MQDATDKFLQKLRTAQQEKQALMRELDRHESEQKIKKIKDDLLNI